MIDTPKNKKVILFDGVCNLCNSSVQRIIKFDKQNKFVFASIQSETGRHIINHLKINTEKTDSIILFIPANKYYIKSSAILKIMNDFGGIWKITQLNWILPRAIRDFIYDTVAKNRYKWFGKKDNCMVPIEEIKSKFLE